MRLLIIDDDRLIVEIVRRIFGAAGYTVDATGRAADGLALAGVGGYSAILVDLVLPDGDGMGVVAELKRLGVGVPVVVLSARGGAAERTAALEAGARDYVTKPFRGQDLLARIDALLAEWNREREEAAERVTES
jgi:DNA-binding response OmpR family regulator